MRVNDVELNVVVQGRGLAVLLVHGFPLDHTMWDEQVEALAPRCRVLAPDLRGFGRSVVSDGTVTMARMADDLAALLDALEVREPLVYAGFSMGGYVGWPFLEKHGRRVRALVAVDTRASADTPEEMCTTVPPAKSSAPNFLSQPPSPHKRSPWTVDTAMPWAVWAWRLVSYQTVWLAQPRGRCPRVASPSTTAASPVRALCLSWTTPASS